MFEGIIMTGFADEIDPNLDKQMEVIGKLGIRHIEMRGVDGKGLVEYGLDEVKEIRKRLDDHGIRLSAVGSPIGKIGIHEDFGPHFELFKHTVEIAKIMGTPFIRMFSFFIPKDEDPDKHRKEVLSRLRSMVDYAIEQDVVLLHENEKGIYGDVARRCQEIMKPLYGDHFKAVFDFANFVQCGQGTIEAYELLKPYIAYVHVKDARSSDGGVTPAGMGDGHVKEILRLLKATGYHGFLSLEPHLADFSGFQALEEGGRLERKLSGEEAFTTAYDALQSILEDI